MKLSQVGLALALGAGVSLHCAAAEDVTAHCVRPSPPAVPAGDTATEAELVAAQGLVKTFNADSEAYLECLKKVETSLNPEEHGQDLMNIVFLYNGMVDTMHKVAEDFNAAVRAYKARSR